MSRPLKALAFVTLENGCQCCISHSQNQDGYVRLLRLGKAEVLHRTLYEFKHGAIPDGHLLHHTCFNKMCVNDEHLEVMTFSDHSILHRAKENHHAFS